MLRLLEAWDGLREKAGWRIGGTVGGVLVATAIILGPTPEGLSEPGKRAGAVALVMALWWLGGVLPATVVALLPLVAFPLLGVMSTAEVAPGYADPLSNLGDLLGSQGRFDAAIEQYRAALRLAPDRAETHFNLGNALASLGRFDEAAGEFADRPDAGRTLDAFNGKKEPARATHVNFFYPIEGIFSGEERGEGESFSRFESVVIFQAIFLENGVDHFAAAAAKIDRRAVQT